MGLDLSRLVAIKRQVAVNSAFLFYCCCLSFGAEVGQESSTAKRILTNQKLALNDVTESVRNYHPLLTATRETLTQAQAQLLSAQGAFDSTLSAQGSGYALGEYDGSTFDTQLKQRLENQGAELYAGFRKTVGELPSYEDYLLTRRGGEFRVGLSLPLLRDRSIDIYRANQLRAVIQIATAKTQIDQRRIELVRGASMAFWFWVAAGERYRIFSELLKVAQRRSEQLRLRVTSGDAARFDLEDNERIILQRQNQVVASERALARAALELSLFYRDIDGSPVVVTKRQLPGFSPISTQGALERVSHAFSLRPELRRLELQETGAKLDQELALNQTLPKLDLLFGLSRDLGGDSSVADESEVKIGLRFELPFENRVGQGRQQLARSQLREILANRQFLREKISNELLDSENAIRFASQRAKDAKKERELAFKLEEGERVRMEMGESNLLVLNLREQSTAEAELRITEAYLDLHLAFADLEAAGATELH